MRSVEEEALVELDGARHNVWAHRIVATAVLSASLVTVLDAPFFGLTGKVFGASDQRNATAAAIKSSGQTAVLFRGERYDARQFLRALFFELAAPGSSHMIVDLDIDVSAATVQGFNGEIAHDVRIRFSERQREILEFFCSSAKSARAPSKPRSETRLGLSLAFYRWCSPLLLA